MNLRAGLAAAAVLLAGACGPTGELQPEGGGWYTTFESSFPEAGGNIRLYRRDDGGRPMLVDERAHVVRFYPPDCILYSPNRKSGVTYAACGRRVPVPIAAYAPWRLSGQFEADDAGLHRVDTVRVVDGRPVATMVRVPIEEIRRVAEAQPELFAGWQAREPETLMVEAVVTEEPVDVDVRAYGGRTPLMDAVVARQQDVVDALLRQGADVNAQDDGGLTPLILAINVFDTDTVIVNRLLDAGADIEARHVTGSTPLIEAAVIKNQDLFQLLLRRGADPCAQDEEGETIVEAAERAEWARAAYERCSG